MYANLQSHALDIFGQASNPGCALAVPGGSWRLTFALG